MIIRGHRATSRCARCMIAATALAVPCVCSCRLCATSCPPSHMQGKEIFGMRFLVFAIHGAFHWTTLVVINSAGLHHLPRYSEPCIVRLDSLKPAASSANTGDAHAHDPVVIAQVVRNFLYRTGKLPRRLYSLLGSFPVATCRQYGTHLAAEQPKQASTF